MSYEYFIRLEIFLSSSMCVHIYLYMCIYLYVYSYTYIHIWYPATFLYLHVEPKQFVFLSLSPLLYCVFPQVRASAMDSPFLLTILLSLLKIISICLLICRNNILVFSYFCWVMFKVIHIKHWKCPLQCRCCGIRSHVPLTVVPWNSQIHYNKIWDLKG